MELIERVDRLADTAKKLHRTMHEQRMSVSEYPIRFEVYKVSQAAELLSGILYMLSVGLTDVEPELEIVQKQVDSLSRYV